MKVKLVVPPTPFLFLSMKVSISNLYLEQAYQKKKNLYLEQGTSSKVVCLAVHHFARYKAEKARSSYVRTSLEDKVSIIRV